MGAARGRGGLRWLQAGGGKRVKQRNSCHKTGRNDGDLHRMRFPLVFAALALLGVSLKAEPILRLAGSTTVRGLLEPHQAAFEAAGRCRLEFNSTGSIAGLLALVSGTADLAMLSMPVEDAARTINQKTPGRVDLHALHAEHIGEIRTVFIVNPHNSVRTLTTDQLVAVLSGQVANWKDVGGADAPVLVVSLGNGGAFLDPLLGGRGIASSARIVTRASQIAAVVAEQSNAIGIINASHPRGPTTILQTDAHIAAPLFLVAHGEPSPAALAVIQAAREALGVKSP